MLEAHAHHELKALLRREGLGAHEGWPHQLSLCRLVARSLRRGDRTLVRLTPGSEPGWLLGLLVPLALGETPVVLVLSTTQRTIVLRRPHRRLATVPPNAATSAWPRFVVSKPVIPKPIPRTNSTT